MRWFASEMQLRQLHLDTRRRHREPPRLDTELEAPWRRDPLTGVGNRLGTLYRAKDASRNATAVVERGSVRILVRPGRVATAA